MIVYHGSNLAVEKPKLITPTRALDFGDGFYTTLNLEQAKTFAGNVVAHNDGRGVPTVSCLTSYSAPSRTTPYTECFANTKTAI